MVRSACLVLLASLSAAAQPVELEPPPRRRPDPGRTAKLQHPAPRAADWIHTANRAAVRSFYQSSLASLDQVPMGFTGNVGAGIAGDTSVAYKAAVLEAVNWYRRMAGVPSASGLDPSYNAKDQQAALMMSANKALSHFPPNSWTHYSAEGAEAAGRSNLCLQWSESFFMPGCISQYIRDAGGSNYPVGHRRWILYPQTQSFGTGDVDGRAEPGYYPLANALWAWDDHVWDPRPATRESFVAWPPPGYVPAPTVYPRWSFSVAGADFGQATVSVELDGVPVSAPKEPVDNGYGENTLVFLPDLGLPGSLSRDYFVDVTISNVGTSNGPQTYQYTTIIFDPSLASSGSVLGVFGNGSWYLDHNGDFLFQAATEQHGWGSPGDEPVRGDWDGDGFDEVGVFSGGVWFLDMNGDGAFNAAAEQKGWGVAGWTPVVGDWDGDGDDDLGAIDPATMTWFLDLNGDFAFQAATEIRGWGTPGDIPVVGDWNGDGADEIGVFAAGNWFLDFDGDGGFQPATDQRGWGMAGWIPVVGDWDGDGADELGAIEPVAMSWFRDLNGDFAFQAVTEQHGWGSAGNTPVVGDWNGDGADEIGVFTGGTWFLDVNGDGVFAPATEQKGWGGAGSTPVPGLWR